MKKLLIVTTAIFTITLAQATETKTVCHDRTDKHGVTKQVCKKIKVHAKFDGTPVPTKK